MFCNKCGGPIPFGNNKCPNCGNKINNENQNTLNQNDFVGGLPGQNIFENNEPKKKNNMPAIITVVVIVIIVIALAFILPSLSTKTIVCKTSQNESGIKIITTISTTFKSNKIDSISLEANYNLGSTYSTYIDTFYEEIDKEFIDYKNTENVKYNISKENNNVIVTIEADRNSAEKIFNTEFDGTDESPSAFIKDAEKDGFICNQK